MPSLVLLAKLCVGPLVLGEAAAPMCTRHVDLFLFLLAEAFRLTHEEVQEDNRYACDASKDEESALGRPRHQRLRREALQSLPEVQSEHAHGQRSIGAGLRGVGPGTWSCRRHIYEDEKAGQCDLDGAPFEDCRHTDQEVEHCNCTVTEEQYRPPAERSYSVDTAHGRDEVAQADHISALPWRQSTTVTRLCVFEDCVGESHHGCVARQHMERHDCDVNEASPCVPLIVPHRGSERDLSSLVVTGLFNEAFDAIGLDLAAVGLVDVMDRLDRIVLVLNGDVEFRRVRADQEKEA